MEIVASVTQSPIPEGMGDRMFHASGVNELSQIYVTRSKG